MAGLVAGAGAGLGASGAGLWAGLWAVGVSCVGNDCPPLPHVVERVN